MIAIFSPSTIQHPWRETLALVAIAVWVSIGLAWLFLSNDTGPIFWYTGEISA